MSGRPRLVLFPGLGMDGRTLEPQRAAVPADVVVPAWVRPEAGESLADYTRRMAAGIPRRGEGPLYLGGVSIGGAIALEAARHVRAEGVFLIASARTSRALPHLLRILGMSAPFVPTFVLRWFARRVAPPAVRVIMRKYPEAREILVTAVRELDLEVWKWGARAIMTWEFEGEMPCPVHQIHGDEDAITPIYRVSPEAIVHGGGHMVNLTHPGEVNAYILRSMQRDEFKSRHS